MKNNIVNILFYYFNLIIHNKKFLGGNEIIWIRNSKISKITRRNSKIKAISKAIRISDRIKKLQDQRIGDIIKRIEFINQELWKLNSTKKTAE